MIAVDTSELIAILEGEPVEDQFLALIVADGAPRFSGVSMLEAGLVERPPWREWPRKAQGLADSHENRD